VTDDAKHRRVGLFAAVVLFFKNYANFRGRSSRGAFWWIFLASILAFVVSVYVDIELFRAQSTDLLTPGSVFALATLLPMIAVSVRRMHDVDRSGWRLLFWIVPLMGVIIAIVFFGKPGTRGENRFGPDIEAGR
jgi:uncharacterized membrane protein YhaH (DUF805 family)